MADFDFDLFVIGAGSGGVRAARISAELGAKVAIAEDYRIGGTCVIRGCIPKKLMVYAAHYAEDFEDAKGYGWTVEKAAFDWASLIAAKDKEIDRLNGLYIKSLENAGVEIFEKRAGMADKHTVVLADGRKLTARYILIATGGHPFMPSTPGIEHAISSNEVFHLDRLPERVLVVGGGYIAVEFAGIFNGLGSQVTQVYRRDKILRGFDMDLREAVEREMGEKGIRIVHDAVVLSIERTENGLVSHLTNGESVESDQVLCAVGRRPNTDGLGLFDAGVELDEQGAVKVDEYSRSSVENIYAVGDVTDRINLTPVAIKEGHAFALTVFGDAPTRPEHDAVPSAVFSQPPIATVGLSEEDARQQFTDVKVFKSSFRALKHTLSGRDEKTTVKLVVDGDTDRLLGAHMIGMDAPEIIQGIAVAVKHGLTKADLDRTVAIHPSSAEEFVLLH